MKENPGRNREFKRATPRQITSRIMLADSLMEGGAIRDSNNRLVLSRELLHSTRRDYVELVATKTQEYAKFIRRTPDGQLIDAYQRGTRNIIRAIKISIGKRVVTSRVDSEPGLSHFVSSRLAEGIDMPRLQRLKSDRRIPDPIEAEYAQEVLSDLSDRIEALDELSLVLLDSPQYRIGQQVAVMRSRDDGSDRHLETGWTVNNISPKAFLEVTHDDITAPVTIDQIISWNKQPNT